MIFIKIINVKLKWCVTVNERKHKIVPLFERLEVKDVLFKTDF